MNITHDEFVKRAERWLKKRGVSLIFRELRTSSRENPDVIGWLNGKSVLIECKASRSDFLSDKKKPFRNGMMEGMGDCRIYFCPPGIIKVEDLPEGWFLIYYDGKVTKNIHGIEGFRMTTWSRRPPFKGNKKAEMNMMYSALRRLQLRGHLHEIYERI